MNYMNTYLLEITLVFFSEPTLSHCWARPPHSLPSLTVTGFISPFIVTKKKPIIDTYRLFSSTSLVAAISLDRWTAGL